MQKFNDWGHCSDVDINGNTFYEDNTVYQLSEWTQDYEIYQRVDEVTWLKIFGCYEANGVGQKIALDYYDRLGDQSCTYHPLKNPGGIQYRLYTYGHLI